jgi:hypothetical protein
MHRAQVGEKSPVTASTDSLPAQLSGTATRLHRMATAATAGLALHDRAERGSSAPVSIDPIGADKAA